MFLDFFFSIYFLSCCFKCLVLILYFSVFMYFDIVYVGDNCDRLVIFLGRLFKEIVRLSSIVCKCCILLFLRWRGFIIFLLYSFLISGLNFCFDFLFVINWVIFVFFVEVVRLVGSFVLKFFICLVIFNFIVYDYGFYL